jgi:long-chain acyl-CoA synthetase
MHPMIDSSHWITLRLQKWERRPALIWRKQSCSYEQLAASAHSEVEELRRRQIPPGSTVAICGDYSPRLCALFLAALFNRNIIVPLAAATRHRWSEMQKVAQVQFAFEFDEHDRWCVSNLERTPDHRLLREIADRGNAGLVLFSSGSTGHSKASLLDFDSLLEKFCNERPAYRTLLFLLLDHIGGINTLFHVLCHGGTAVLAEQRAPDAVCAAISEHRVQLLPATPTFLRMLMISDAITRHDLSSLEIVTYGAEPMPASTLSCICRALPQVRFKQTYGLSELGIMPTQSRSSQSLWMKLGNAGFDHRIVDGVLWIKSATAMLGYLNAAPAFDDQGWFNTQDVVEVDGEYVRILGRRSELINVGGEKVHPTEIENVLLELDNVKEVTVSGRPNPVVGQVVAARITPLVPEHLDKLKQRVRAFCKARLAPFKVPAVIEIIDADQHSTRFKKVRPQLS